METLFDRRREQHGRDRGGRPTRMDDVNDDENGCRREEKEQQQQQPFDVIWARKLAERARKRAEKEKKRREKTERHLVEQSEENERLRWEVARAKRMIRMIEKAKSATPDEDEEEENDDENIDGVARHLASRILDGHDEEDRVSSDGEGEDVDVDAREKEEVILVLDDGKEHKTWTERTETGTNEEGRVGRDRCIVVSAREEGFGKHENDEEEENFLSSEIAQRVEQSKATSSDKDRNETLEVCDDIDDDARCLLDGRDALEIEPMPLSDCTTHVLLLLCEIVRFLRMESLPFDDDDHIIGSTGNGHLLERKSLIDSRRSSRMNSTVLSRSSIHMRSNSNATSTNKRISTIYDSKPTIGGDIHKHSAFLRKQVELNSVHSSPSIQYDLMRFVKSWFIKSHGSHELATWHLRAFAATLRKLRKINTCNVSTTSIATSHTPLARIFSRLLGCCQPLPRDERVFVITVFSAMFPPERSAKKVPLCKKNQTPMVFLDDAERSIKYAFRRSKIPTKLRSALRNHAISSDGYTLQDLQQYFAGSNDDQYAIDVGIALDLALTELIQLKKAAELKFSETFDATFRHRVSKPLMHRPIVRTLLKEAGASGEEADALAAEVFEACHEETEHMMLKQRKNISVIGTLEEHVGSDLMLDMGVLSKAVFAKCASEILPGICLNDTCNESGRDENNENIQLPNNNDTISDDYMNPLLPNRQENSPVSPSSSPVTAPVAAASAPSASIEVVLSLDALAYAWNKTESFIDKTLASRAETNFIGNEVAAQNTSSSSSTSSSSTTFALFKAQPTDPQKRRDVDELFERAEKLRRTMSYALRAARTLSCGTSRTASSSSSSPAVATATASSCDENVKTAWSTYCGATCAFERAVQAQRTALGLEDDDNASGSFWF